MKRATRAAMLISDARVFSVLRFNNHDVMTNREGSPNNDRCGAGKGVAPSLPSPASGGGGTASAQVGGQGPRRRGLTMKFTLAWLKEHLDTDASLDEIVDKLTMIGLEVERVEDKAKALAPFVIARVIAAEAASQCGPAARLHGRYRRRRADPGRVRRAECAHRHDRRVRAAGRVHSGQEHHARRSAPSAASRAAACWCSEFELELSDDHDGIIELPADAPLGAALCANGPASTIR